MFSKTDEKAEAFQINPKFRFKKLHEFEIDGAEPPMGVFVMWEEPKPGYSYTLGVDTAEGLGRGSDRSAIHVLRNGTMHAPDIQVGEFIADELNVHEMTPICYMLGSLYSSKGQEALITVEVNKGDEIPYDLRTRYNYGNIYIRKQYDAVNRVLMPKLGWLTTPRTRPSLIAKTLQYIKHDWWIINSPWLINELQTLEKNEAKQKIQAAAGCHDDLYMAGALALWSAHDLEFSDETGAAEVAQLREKRRADILEAQVPLPPIDKRQDYANTDCTVEEMDEDFYNLLEREI